MPPGGIIEAVYGSLKNSDLRLHATGCRLGPVHKTPRATPEASREGSPDIARHLPARLAIAVMQLTRTVHPPAGGDPLVVILAGAGWSFLILPVLAGTVLLVAAAIAYHRLISLRAYPG